MNQPTKLQKHKNSYKLPWDCVGHIKKWVLNFRTDDNFDHTSFSCYCLYNNLNVVYHRFQISDNLWLSKWAFPGQNNTSMQQSIVKSNKGTIKVLKVLKVKFFFPLHFDLIQSTQNCFLQKYLLQRRYFYVHAITILHNINLPNISICVCYKLVIEHLI